MSENPASAYIESQQGGYYLAGTRVSLASVVHAFRQGVSPETILQDFPYIGSLNKVYGAIAFILENPVLVNEYLAKQEQLWQELESQFPLPHDMVKRYEKVRELLERLPA